MRPIHLRHLLAGALLGLPLLGPSRLPAQVGPPELGAGAAYETYRFRDPSAAGIASLSLLTTPVGAAVPLPGALRLELGGAFARGVLVRQDGSQARIQGLTDTQLRLGIPVVGDRLVLSGILLAPTGTATATREEAEVAGAIASDLLPFRISHWTSGGGAGLGLTAAHSFGATALGLGASYLVTREFDPLAQEGLAAYRPGDQLGLQAALNHTVGGAGKLSVQISVQQQADDRLEGDNLFRAGNRYQAIGSYAFRAGRASSGIVYAGGQHRAQGAALLELTRDTPAQDLALLGGGFRIPLARSVVLLPGADGRLFRAEDGVGQGYLGGLGASLEIARGALRVVPRLRANTGTVLVREGTSSRFVGLDAGVTLNLGALRP